MPALNALKSRLLDLAIRGMLVPQIDGEAEVGQIGKPLKESPFVIPRKWKWGRLSDYGSIVGGGTPSTSVPEYWNGEISWITPADLGKIQSPWVDRGAKSITELGLKNSAAKKMPAGSVIYSSRAPIGRVAIAKNELCTSQGCKSFVPDPTLIDSKYAYFALIALTPEIIARASGTTFKEISGKQFGKTLIPVPPLKEQQRIVEKLDNLFSKIDVIQKSMDEASRLGEFLEKQILLSAIGGKLVPQLDEEAEVEQIGQTPEETPFVIPKKWKWGKLSNYGNIVGGGTPSTSVGEYWNGEISWITPADLGKIQSPWVDRGAKSITESGLENSSAKKMPAGSIVYSSRAPIGRVAIAKNELCTSQGCKSFVPDPDLVDSKYAYFALTALTPDIVARASGTTFKEISGKQFGKTLIPIPPLREQRRIVEKLDKLMLEIQKLK